MWCIASDYKKTWKSDATKYDIMQYVDQMMELFLEVFACRSAAMHEEAMLAIDALAYATSVEFAKIKKPI